MCGHMILDLMNGENKITDSAFDSIVWIFVVEINLILSSDIILRKHRLFIV
jgi:hypothetical protein